MSLLDEPIPQDDLMRDRTRVFEEFLDAETGLYNYKAEIGTMLRLDKRRLIINIDDLHRNLLGSVVATELSPTHLKDPPAPPPTLRYTPTN